MKIIRPNNRPPSNSPARRPVDFERWKTPYIQLECGHPTDWDTQLVYSAMRPIRGRFFCEIHNKWYRNIKVIKAEKESSQESLF